MTMIAKAKARLRGSLLANRKGNAALLVALGMPVLIGGAGLAVDTAQWFMWKRELQHSVDQAAIGAAWALSQDESKDMYRVRAQQEYLANLGITKGFALPKDQITIRLANYASGTGNSVVVESQATKRLPFSSMLMSSAATVKASAQASYQDGMNYNACLVALAKDTGVIDIGGSATIKARCGLAALSCEVGAITVSGAAKLITDSVATCGTVTGDEDKDTDGETNWKDVVNEGVKGLEDIYAKLVPPTATNQETVECKGKGQNKVATLKPGLYKGGLVPKCNAVLAKGIYVVDGGELDLAGNYDVTANGVMFVLKGGARMKLGGSGNSSRLALSPMQEDDFRNTPYADKAKDYAGMLIFEDRNNNPGNPGHTLNGNLKSLIEGLIYLPSGEINILGTAQVAAQCLQISAYKIKVKGNADLETLCPVDETMSVGHSVAQVRLVA